MRPLERREKQRRSLLCPASPAACCQERRESLSRPCHNFSIGRHLWFCPKRSPPRQGVAEQSVECCSDRPTTFSCDFPPVFFASHPRQSIPDATVENERGSQEVVENRRAYDKVAEFQCVELHEKSPTY